MGLGDVHDQEGDTVAILLVELIEGGSLPPEWRSSVATEDEHHRLPLVHFSQMDDAALVHLREREIWSGVSDVESPGASPGP